MEINSDETKNLYTVESLIVDCIHEFSIIKKINTMVFVITILEEKKIATKDLKKIKKEILEIYNDKEVYRKMCYRDSLLREHRAEYYGLDYGENDPFTYRKEIEDFVIKLNNIIINALAKAYLQIRKEDEIDISKFG